MGQQFDGFNKKLESTLTELKHLKKENDIIKAGNSRLSNEILEIKQKLDTFEQQNLAISVEINSVPKSNIKIVLPSCKQLLNSLLLTPQSPKQLELYYWITESR